MKYYHWGRLHVQQPDNVYICAARYHYKAEFNFTCKIKYNKKTLNGFRNYSWKIAIRQSFILSSLTLKVFPQLNKRSNNVSAVFLFIRHQFRLLLVLFWSKIILRVQLFKEANSREIAEISSVKSSPHFNVIVDSHFEKKYYVLSLFKGSSNCIPAFRQRTGDKLPITFVESEMDSV